MYIIYDGRYPQMMRNYDVTFFIPESDQHSENDPPVTMTVLAASPAEAIKAVKAITDHSYRRAKKSRRPYGFRMRGSD